MTAWRQENISLIKTVPERLRGDLRAGINQTFAERPFDQQALSKVVRERGQSAGYNLRRITRDQTNKAVGQLTQARHQQLGVEEYIWQTVQDERVRSSHAVLNGKRRRWDKAAGGISPGSEIQCRCVAIPVIPEVDAIGAPKPKPKPKPRPKPKPKPAPKPKLEPDGLAARGFDPDRSGQFVDRHKVGEAYRKLPDFVPDGKQLAGVQDYTDLGYKPLNKAMREKLPLGNREKEMLRDIVASAKPLREQRVLFRGVSGRQHKLPKYNIGDNVTFHAPTSTSGWTGQAGQFSGGGRGSRMIEITANRGVKTTFGSTGEVEHILLPGQQMRIVNIFKNVEVPLGPSGPNARTTKIAEYIVGVID